MRTEVGIVASRWPVRSPGLASAGVAAGAKLVPFNTTGSPPGRMNSICMPAPRPDMAGSVTASENATATAASMALPPASRISRPAAAASGEAAETTPWAPAGNGDTSTSASRWAENFRRVYLAAQAAIRLMAASESGQCWRRKFSSMGPPAKAAARAAVPLKFT